VTRRVSTFQSARLRPAHLCGRHFLEVLEHGQHAVGHGRLVQVGAAGEGTQGAGVLHALTRVRRGQRARTAECSSPARAVAVADAQGRAT